MLTIDTNNVAGFIVPVRSPDPKGTGIQKRLGLKSPLANVAVLTWTANHFSEIVFIPEKGFPGNGLVVDLAKWPTSRSTCDSLTKTHARPTDGTKEKGAPASIITEGPLRGRSANVRPTSAKQKVFTFDSYHKLPQIDYCK